MMPFVVRRLLPIAALILPCVAHALEWRFVDKVTPPTKEHAFICHLWSATVFAPGEKGSCYMGTIYAADLTTGEIGYAYAGGAQGMPAAQSERKRNLDTLMRALSGESVAKLDALHDKLEADRAATSVAATAERQKAEAERVRAEYLQAFEESKTLEKIRDFEARYSNDDPDGLIARLAPAKATMEHQAYRNAYAGAATAVQLQAFVDTYAGRDPEKLVPEVRRRLAAAKKQEQVAQQAAEKKAKDDAVKQQAAARQAALKKDADRLQNIQALRAKYFNRITADSPEGYGIVSNYRIDCRTGDGRVLPLLNALYASMSYDGGGLEMRFHIQNRGSQVRITSVVIKNGKSVLVPQISYEVNEWGELRAVAIRNEAVLNLCYGSHGALWLMPGEPGYQ